MRRAGLDSQNSRGFFTFCGGARLTVCRNDGAGFICRFAVAEPATRDMPEQVEQPEYATVVGLVLYGAKAANDTRAALDKFVAKLKAMFAERS